ncbi:hypothetical protein [Tepidibacter formicigenes]|jgi:hypothetical protein|uniref:Uncharacterized protein n=1 Tax=Tepidibacter formicigenes DSM 15518 TaxID=1123349 RepID=A0A1M6SFG9_9FIRM|nr:hypothetical protein [Tepidibacter formicigenes]SHK43409.1 hypothetical protein SAMN02744037_02333 [Tepidibacter formicigenes DSM 15518]
MKRINKIEYETYKAIGFKVKRTKNGFYVFKEKMKKKRRLRLYI